MRERQNNNIGFYLFLAGFLSTLFFTGLAWSAEVSLSATVDRTQATLEDSITLSLKVRGVRNSPPPQLPPLPDFQVQVMGTSSSVQIINSQMSVSVTHNYRLTPKRAGSLGIGPAKLEIGGDIYTSDPITVVIKKVSAAQPAQNVPAFAEISVSNLQPYVNEQVVLTFKLYRRVDAQNINLNISHDRFRKEDLGDAKEYTEVINGLKYGIYELPVALFPTRPGPTEIPSAVVEIDLLYRQKRSRGPFDSFFSNSTSVQHKSLRTKSVQVEVLPLPSKGKPDNFANLVGQFALTATLGKHSVEVGGTTTLTITVSGTGNIENAELSVPKLPGKFKIYSDQPQLEKSITGNKVSGKKVFKFALVPLQEGETAIPSIPLSFFDPQARRYVTLATKPLTLKATPATDVEHLKVVDSDSRQATPSDIRVLGKDIFPIHTVLRNFRDQRLEGVVFYIAGFILPVLLFLGFVFYHNHQRRLRDDVAFSRTRRAYKVAREKLNQLSSADDSRDFAARLSQILREYIGDKLNLQGTAFTATEVEIKLKEKQYPEAQVIFTRKLLEKFEAYQYARTQNAQSSQLLDESLEVLKQLEERP